MVQVVRYLRSSTLVSLQSRCRSCSRPERGRRLEIGVLLHVRCLRRVNLESRVRGRGIEAGDVASAAG